MYRIKININIILIMLFCSVFLVPQQVRVGIINYKLGILNYFALALICILVLLFYKFMKKEYLFLIVCCIVYFSIGGLFYEPNISTIIFSILCYIAPFILLSIRVDSIQFEKIFTVFLKVFNCVIILITAIGLLDRITNNYFINLLSPLMTERMQELINAPMASTRMYSIYGHPLFNTELYLMFILLNSIKQKYFTKNLNNILVQIISLIGILLTASKTGIILFLCTIFLVNFNKKNIKYFIYFFIIGVFLLNLGAFNNILLRFTTESLTTGRSDMWKIVTHHNLFPIKFFSGYGRGFTFTYANEYLKDAQAAFEYPIRMFSLEFGTMSMLLLYSVMFILPIIELFRSRNTFLILSFMIIFLDINTYNGLALLGDYMLVFCIFAFLVLNTSKHAKLNI